jgi:hypothetical protein
MRSKKRKRKFTEEGVKLNLKGSGVLFSKRERKFWMRWAFRGKDKKKLNLKEIAIFVP